MPGSFEYAVCSDGCWCESLSQFVQMGNGNTKGIKSISYVNMKDASAPMRHSIYYTPGRGHRGLAFNFCPYCGADIQSLPGVKPRPTTPKEPQQ